MTLDQAHDIACRALGADPRVGKLLESHGDALYSSLLPPGPGNDGQWVELVLLGSGDARFVDDPRGQAVVVARCLINPTTGRSQVIVEAAAEPGGAPATGRDIG